MASAFIPPLGCMDLFGQEKAKKLLAASFASNRLPHALLFSGPDGVGKALFARGVAAAVNCTQKKSDMPLFACGTCASCSKLLHDNHPDFQRIVPQNGVMKIALIRRLIQSLEYPPYESSMRVSVLENAHTMRREAANALLKTLEEPQPGNLLILTIDSAAKMLDTISSRCQTIPFQPLSLSAVTAVLAGYGIAEADARLFALLTSGSPGVALQLQKTGIVTLWQEIIAFLLGIDEANGTAAAEEQLFTLLHFAERMADAKENLPVLLGLFRRWLRDLLLEDRQALALSCGDFAEDALKCWSKEELFAKLQALEQAEKELARNCQRAPVCEVLLFALQARRKQW